jgi:ornithine cyclodeaminase/alanine dehydrogenase-like protein (mu-crystallin family)
MSASIPEWNLMGLKAYGTSRTANGFVVVVFEEQTGVPKALFEADVLGRIRTGAASGLATDLLARKESRVGAIFGSGAQAETQLLALDLVRSFDEVRIFSRNAEKRKEFIRRMQNKVRARLKESRTAEECASDADVISTITSSRQPVLLGKWLKQGCHVNAAGVNWADKRELDEEVVHRSDLIVVDDREQSKIEAGDLVAIAGFDWTRTVELADVVKGKAGRASEAQITLFKSNGIALEDIAAAHFVLSKL